MALVGGLLARLFPFVAPASMGELREAESPGLSGALTKQR